MSDPKLIFTLLESEAELMDEMELPVLVDFMERLENCYDELDVISVQDTTSDTDSDAIESMLWSLIGMKAMAEICKETLEDEAKEKDEREEREEAMRKRTEKRRRRKEQRERNVLDPINEEEEEDEE
ncbi:hypothetical protein AAE478_009213 [Parahypoxylon ruwenzoriense]